MSWEDAGKLTPEDIANIIVLSKTMTTQKIADQFKVDRKTVHYHLEQANIIIWNKRKKIVDKQKIVDKLPRRETLKRGLNDGKSYKELLAIENEKRKKMGLYVFKISSGKRLKGL